MRIIHLVEAWKGGIATYVTALINHQTDSGHEVHLLCDKEKYNSDQRTVNAEVHFYHSSRSPIKLPVVHAEVRKILHAVQPEILHAHSTFAGLYSRTQLKPRYKAIYTPHAWSFLKQDSTKAAQMVFRKLERILSYNCEKIFCMSLEEVRLALEAGIDQRKIELIYSGIPDIHYREKTLSSNPEEQNLNVGFFGRFDFQKGYDVFVEAADLLRPGISLHAFGDSVISSRTKHHPRIQLHGWLDHEKIGRAMAEMDAVVVPSRWEGFALTPLESMRSGTPVIGANTSSIPEMIIHGFNGLLMKSYSAQSLAQTINQLNASDCIALGRNARLTYEQTFTFDHFLQSIDAAYSRVANVGL